MKIMTVLGTRPEIIRLSCVMRLLDSYMTQVIVHTGQNFDYELNEIFFDDLELRKPDYLLATAGKTPSENVSLIISKVDNALEKEKPDALLVLGDTNSCLAAYPAKRRKIPIFHMEAGNRCFDDRVPEEINRRLVDHLSDINLPYSQISRQYLIREGIPPDRIIVTGSPMYEVLHYNSQKIETCDIHKRLNLCKNDYFLISCHREENIDFLINIEKFLFVLKALAKEYDHRIIVTTHPRTRMRMKEQEIKIDPKIEFHKPFSFTEYVKLESNAKAVLSDSGTITEESSILNFAALNIREVHERPEAMEEGSVILTGLEWDRIYEALNILFDKNHGGQSSLQIVKDYDVPNVSIKVLRIILSYTDYVNRSVWRKS